MNPTSNKLKIRNSNNKKRKLENTLKNIFKGKKKKDAETSTLTMKAYQKCYITQNTEYIKILYFKK